MAHFLLVFDLDGTLVDSVPDLTNTLNKVLHERGYAPLTRADVAPMESLMGLSMDCSHAIGS